MRKITPQKWIQEPDEILTAGDIDAECLSDLNADNNSISTWYVGNKTNEEIITAVAALASGFRSLDDISIVLIDEDELKKEGFSVIPSDGVTRIKGLEGLHRDINSLSVDQLGNLAHVIIRNVWNDNTMAFNAEELSIIMLHKIIDGKLELQDLDKNFRKGFSGKVKKIIRKKLVDWDPVPTKIKASFEDQWLINKKSTNCKYELECEKYKH